MGLRIRETLEKDGDWNTIRKIEKRKNGHMQKPNSFYVWPFLFSFGFMEVPSATTS